MRNKKTVFLCLIILAVFLQPPLAIGDPGWLTGWDYRVKITIDSGDVDTPLTEFPILIYLSNNSGIGPDDISFIFDEVGANSLKIAVTTSDGETECYVEVEKWDSSNEKAWLWAKIPSISNITDTEIYLYYDNDHADNTDKVGPTNSAPAENVWDSDFKLVTHMRDDPDNTAIRDSTGSDYDGAKKGAGEPALLAAGLIDGSQDFDGGDDFVSMGDVLDILANQDFTLEAWIKPGSEHVGMVINKATAVSMTGFDIYLSTDHIRARVGVGGGVALIGVGAIVPDNDYYLAALFDRDGLGQLYLNGATDGAAVNIAGKSGDTSNAKALNIGRRADGGTLEFDGIIDEVRISWTVREPAWVKATHQTGIDNMLDYGKVQEIPLPYVPTKLFGAGFNDSSPYVSLYWTSNFTNVDLFEVQNSTDKISWDYLGTNTTAEYHDFQVINGTERYYRVRACNFEYGEWFNSTFTDINLEKVYFVMPIGDGACEYHIFNASSITVIAGTLNDGNLASTYAVDGDWYNVSEVHGPPGMDVRFNFTYIGGNITCGCIEIYKTYTGHSQHEIQIQVWNFTSSSWHKIGQALYNETADWVCIGLGHTPEHYLSGGEIWFRFYHPTIGHINHELHIDRIDLRVVYAEECPACPPCEEPPALVAMGKFYAMSIILLILGILIGLGMRKR